MIQFLPIFTALVISVTTFSLALYLLDLIWLKPGHCQIPLENPQLESNPSIRSSLKGNEDKQVKGLSEMLKIYLPLIRSLDSKYWIQHVGLDGYTYLYFERQLLVLLSIVGGVVAVVVPTFNIFFSKTRQPEDLSDPTVRFNVYNDYYELRSLVDCSLLYLFTIGTIFTTFRIKWHIRDQLIIIKNDKSAQEELPKLKSRSVHVRGMFPEDRRGDYLKSEVRRILDTMDGNGRIVATIVVPDFTKMIELENARKRIDNAQKLYDAKEPAVRRLCFPEKFRHADYYEKRRRAIDENIEKEIMKPVVCSGHAFMCFDSVRTRDYVLQYYKPDAKNTFEAFRHNLPINRKSLMKRKVTSTFQKFNDEIMLKELEDRQLNIFMDPLESPFDIFWANLGGTREFFKLIFGIIAFFFLIFLSTPESMLTFLQKLPGMGFLNAAQYISDKDELGSLMRQIVKAFWIMIFNQIFIQIMTFSAYFEKHRSFTLLQLSIFSKALFYLLLNTLVVPTFTLVSGYSLFQMILHRGSYLFEVVKMFYFLDTGRFFIIVLLQSGAFSALSSLIRTGEIINSFGSSWLAYYSRNYLNDLEKWRKKEADVFSYGFLSAQIIIAFTIVVTYAIPVPGIIFAGISYFAMRYFVDGFNLLTVFKKEIDSGGNMIGNVLKYVLCACLLPQVALSISFGYNGYLVPCVLSAVLVVVMLVSIYRISSPVYVEDDDPGLKEEGSQNLREDINRWEAAYRHPLLVTPSEITVQRGERMISFRLPTEQAPIP